MRILGYFLLSVFALMGFLFCLLLGLGGYALSQFQEDPLPETMVLSLEIGDSLPEDPASGFLDQMSDLLAGEEPRARLVDVVAAIDRAAEDPAVRGLFLHVRSGTLGMAQAQELRAAVLRFRQKSDKETVAFAESFGEGADGTIPYYVATAAKDIWLQPSGLVGTTGFAVRQPYLRGLLDEWGVEPEFQARKQYKTAMAFLSDYQQSPAEREALQGLVDGWLSQVVAGIVSARGLPEQEVRTLIDASPLLAPVANEGKLIDYIGYRDQIVSAMGLSFRAGDNLSSRMIPLARYVRAHAATPADARARKIAYICATGTIVVGDGRGVSGSRMVDARALASTIERAAADSEVVAIVLRIDSPGGSYVGSDVVWRAIEKVREAGMPVIASLGDVAASGGYFMAMGTSHIVAQPGTLTGSIGVVSGKVNIQALSTRNRVAWDGVQAGRNAAMYALSQPFDEAARAHLSATLDAIYADFTGKVARGRSLSLERVEEAAQGRVWLGEQALKLGLVDELGGLPEAIRAARREAGLDESTPYTLVPFGSSPSPFGLFAKNLDRVETILNLGVTLSPGLRAAEPWLRTLDGEGAVLMLEPLSVNR
ncbi:signal peptide peptidase SppA [Phaeovibrio sulfidiphilus]|uniref:Signal peptide peptidase SppA n=1 Tax=Phaeovibrio sulfidiphilus TaxID=1220600 RepID=A0A8J7CWP6_9PROT|nr:signal peptide peptidase SppA [Phaeovibrio sulfidiphilus]MBE1237756.1 signal peptide peptidase SppA [Phaeovibrio sulfidiphilus]